MAIVNANPIVEGLSGMLGKTIVFKNLRGKTIIANRPARPTKQSEQQRANRSKFKNAAFWAKSVLRDPIKKAYYQKKAKKLKLPNAYTAAITDYMRTPQVREWEQKKDVITYRVSKNDFDVKKVEVRICDPSGKIIETRAVEKDWLNDWMFRIREAEL